MAEVKAKTSCNSMSNSVAAWIRKGLAMLWQRRPRPAKGLRRREANAAAHAPDRARKDLNQAERQRLLDAVHLLKRIDALFVRALAWTGARISEALALTPASFDVERSVVSLRTLKRRMFHLREVPIPPELMRALDHHFGIT